MWPCGLPAKAKHSQMKRSAPWAMGRSASVHSVSPEKARVRVPSETLSAVEGAPEPWITSAVVRVKGPCREVEPGSTSLTSKSNRQALLAIFGKSTSTWPRPSVPWYRVGR